MDEKNNNFIKIGVKCFCISIVFTIISIFILSAILCYSNVSEKIIDVALITISAIAILIGTFLLERKIKEKGLFYGGIFGIVYIVGLFLISSFVSADFSIGLSSGIMMAFGILAGILGGIIGVNFNK